MRRLVEGFPQIVEVAERAIRAEGIEPVRTPIRGGTDGSILSRWASRPRTCSPAATSTTRCASGRPCRTWPRPRRRSCGSPGVGRRAARAALGAPGGLEHAAPVVPGDRAQLGLGRTRRRAARRAAAAGRTTSPSAPASSRRRSPSRARRARRRSGRRRGGRGRRSSPAACRGPRRRPRAGSRPRTRSRRARRTRRSRRAARRSGSGSSAQGVGAGVRRDQRRGVDPRDVPEARPR